ncbi:hypothetical protein D3C74_227660 [compost metagenome]
MYFIPEEEILMAGLDKVRNTRAITVDLGGRQRVIKFDLNAFAELEEKYGSIQDAFTALSKGKIKDVRTVLWTGLVHEEVNLDDNGEPIGYNITPYQVGGWVDTPQAMNQIAQKVTMALKNDMPDAEVKVTSPATAPTEGAATDGGVTVVYTAEELEQLAALEQAEAEEKNV